MHQEYLCYEIVIIDDGSNDGTSKFLIDCFKLSQIEFTQNQYILNHKPILNVLYGINNCVSIYLIQKENGGKADALNAGVCFCHGDYFVCTDADCIFSLDALNCLSNAIYRSKNVVAVGGRVLPLSGLFSFLHQKRLGLKEVIQAYQELEYGIAFSITRCVFNKLGTSMLISGALGLFNKDIVIQLGGYALDTVGEDMELVMKIRQYINENNKAFKIEYAKQAVCYTQLPWNEYDLRKQRIRWTIGLTDVLYKYREIVIHKKYSFLERLTFWYYVIFEKFSPHIELTSFIICIILGFSNITIILFVITILFQILLSIIGSFQSIKNAYKSSKNKLKTLFRLFILMITFVSIYHLWHSFYRLIAVPVYRKQIYKNKNHNISWTSPRRM